MIDHPLDPSVLLNGTDLRLTLRASLKPASGLDRFQPAGFPEIGHVIYDAPRSDNSMQKVCIVDSAASMANHLETVCLASQHSLELADELDGMPYVECRTEAGWPNIAEDAKGRPDQLVVTTLSEGHRLASEYILGRDKGTTTGMLVANGQPSTRKFRDVLRTEFGIVDLRSKSHPLPEQWWAVFSTIFGYDPNSLVHGVLFPAMGIKLPRVLTAHLEAFDAARVRSSGVKFDKLGKTSSGQPIFSVDEETANEIVATFVIDLALLRSFGRRELGLNAAKKEFLLALALWKIKRLLRGSFRYRSNCDLELHKLCIRGREEPVELPAIDIRSAIANAGFRNPPVTQVYWPAEELFRQGVDGPNESSDPENEQDTED